VEITRQYLAAHPYFRALSPVELAKIAQLASSRTLARGEMLALEGDACTSVYFVVQGRIRAFKISPQGREQVVSELGAGQAFYIPPALDGGPLPVTTQAATKATLISFSRQDFLLLLQRHPSIAMQVLVDLARRLRQLSSLVEDLSLRSVQERLARVLLERAGTSEGRHLTQREMAAQLGTVREVLARALSQFEHQGWIRVRRGLIEIIDPQALRRIVSEEDV